MSPTLTAWLAFAVWTLLLVASLAILRALTAQRTGKAPFRLIASRSR